MNKDEAIAADLIEPLTEYYQNYADLGLEISTEALSLKDQDMKIMEVKMQNTINSDENNLGYIKELETKLEQVRDDLDLKKKEFSNLKRNAVNDDSDLLLEKISRLEEKLLREKRENKVKYCQIFFLR